MPSDHSYDPYTLMPPVPWFTLTSEQMKDGDPMPEEQRGYLDNVSPQLSWSGFPAETRSFLVSVYDPDAPTVSGWWHWNVVNVPADVTSLPRGAGAPDGAGLPPGAVQLRHDGNEPGYFGAAPPPGDGPHRYMFVVSALDVERLDVTPDLRPARLQGMARPHTIARARLTVTCER